MMTEFKPRFLKPSNTTSFLDKDESVSIETTDFIYNKHLSQSIQTQRQRLPIFNNRNHILYLVEKYQTLVLIGETGCGKSTQIPQYLIEAEWPKQIGVCEPRRVAAISLANRVADETGTLVQQDIVGYAVRFDACYNNPKIKYMTEGILLREMMADPLLKNYSLIMLDEAHERSLYTDILMGLMKKILKKRKELRLIVASATLDANELQQFFNENPTGNKKNDTAVIMSVEGRQFPVDIFYVAEPVPCYIQASVDTVLKINSSKEPGDILVFLTGQEEVERTVRLLNEHENLIEQSRKKERMMILPMYGSLPHHDQLKVFRPAPDGCRKVIVATNVAETSVTIPGIVHVVDCGFVKLKWYNNEAHTDSLITVPISKSSANQRAGRAGRVRSGKVYSQNGPVIIQEETPCEIQMLRYYFKNVSSCQQLAIRMPKLRIQKLEKNHWILTSPEISVDNQKCGSNKDNFPIQGTFILELDSECEVNINGIIINHCENYQTEHKLINFPNLTFPSEISKFQMEPIQLHSINLDEFKHIQSALDIQKQKISNISSPIISANFYIWTVFSYFIIIIITLYWTVKFIQVRKTRRRS
ncbi:probable ATP-dependent RNA helicase DHX35 isoform X2 [Diorhabda sublineata]|uniref:probable ATP-dependent RNA helicase DHX35 isoform X2 n=1 Tax=Diorhabda sublineata TaxID=1163346 RepID=UPI0024E17AEF|nr:probable ATP-dependent RNA helicase DHX35 isoform X2 [Diorhabda sublineata]